MLWWPCEWVWKCSFLFKFWHILRRISLIHSWSYLVLNLCSFGFYCITDSVSLLVVGLFIFSFLLVQSSRLYIARMYPLVEVIYYNPWYFCSVDWFLKSVFSTLQDNPYYHIMFWIFGDKNCFLISVGIYKTSSQNNAHIYNFSQSLCVCVCVWVWTLQYIAQCPGDMEAYGFVSWFYFSFNTL